MSPLLGTFGNSSARAFRSSKKAPVVVFDESTGPNSSGTGGWYYQHNDGGWVSIGTNWNSVYTYSPWWSSGNAVTNNTIDTTGAVSVTIVFQGYSDNQYGYAWINFPGGGLTLIHPGQMYRGKGEVTIPLSDGGGVGRISFGAANARQYNYLYAFTINF